MTTVTHRYQLDLGRLGARLNLVESVPSPGHAPGQSSKDPTFILTLGGDLISEEPAGMDVKTPVSVSVDVSVDDLRALANLLEGARVIHGALLERFLR